METLTLKARAGKDGVLRLEIPTNQADQELEIVLVMQRIINEPVDAMGYPLGYFDETYGSLADDPIERNQPSHPDVRDEIE
ncbi:MAG: hypothetical protein IAE83_00230 [Anaerolinea sp.]|nr:hypothetical protein [Anaerolinea sp.]CAG1008478.1 hypothetical protein ANRL4_03893 [Anaerolineae bacterium]